MRLRFLKCTIVAYVLVPSVAFPQSLNGAMLGNTCAGCHGTLGGAENVKIPPLAGQDAAQFVATMRAYRDGSKSGTIMNRVARAYSDAEIDAMAAYFSALHKQANE
ncbi:cytochrome C [Profundibacter amoris]|uniref:Cytochrome C n=2 Tax=Profundibacter amoris TaxID=2171755 RepID=A0A347UD44_9RHOB|nr:cytochrome C [Profundibacter amoris]